MTSKNAVVYKVTALIHVTPKQRDNPTNNDV